MAEKAEFTPIKGDEDAALNPKDERKNRRSRKKCIAVTTVVVIVLVIAAFIGGYLVRRAINPGCKDKDKEQEKHENGDQDSDSRHKKAIEAISKERIKKKLK